MKKLHLIAGLMLSISTVILVHAETPPVPAGAVTAVGDAARATKRAACEASTQALAGQDKRDQLQLCIAQARVDCLKQAIDQKLLGPKRREFIKSCVGTEE